MSTVLIEYNLRVVPDEVVARFRERTTRSGSALTEIPELPGVCLDRIDGISKGGEPLSLATLVNRFAVEHHGEMPTGFLLVRRDAE